jgi:fucose permease
MNASSKPAVVGHNLTTIKWLTYLMFMMFAMTTDSVGVIIPEVIREFKLSLTSASAFHYGTMGALAVAGISLGFLADLLGHKRSIILGLTVFAASSCLFSVGHSFGFFLSLLVVSGIAIGIFKTGALALIGDISTSNTNHTAIMNAVEGFFGIGAIIGPAVVASLLKAGIAWKWLYVIAAALSLVLLVIAALVRYPHASRAALEPVNLRASLRMMRHPHAMGFALGLFMYVAVECAIYVWMPTLFAGYHGSMPFMATYAISIFFVLRAAGRFLGTWLLSHLDWTTALAIVSAAILMCFVGSLVGGIEAAVFLLPLSGLFMSIVYPTLNSKGISCFPKALHGTVAGLNLFFSCAAAALGPLAMGAVGDAFSGARSGFALATGFAALLCAGSVLNWLLQPARARLSALDASEYAAP